ncbi:MAG: hypothetical protein R3A44_34805 [Caldilineaceae bacterium]
MKIISVPELQKEAQNIIAQLPVGPVTLMNQNEPAAIMITPAMWQQLMEQLDDQQDAIDALTAMLELATGKVQAEPVDMAPLKEYAQR